jgi:hypothetical protein
VKAQKIFNELIQRDSSIASCPDRRMDRLRFMAQMIHSSSAKVVDEHVKENKRKKISDAGEKNPVKKNYNEQTEYRQV